MQSLFEFPKMSLTLLLHFDCETQWSQAAWCLSAASSQQGPFVWILALVLWVWGLHVLAVFVPVSYHTKRRCAFHAPCGSQTTTVWNEAKFHILYVCIGHMVWGETRHETRGLLTFHTKKIWKRKVNMSVILCYKDKSTTDSFPYKFNEITTISLSLSSFLVSLLCLWLSAQSSLVPAEDMNL